MGLYYFSFVKLPEIVHIHFDASGSPDGYGNKLTLCILPVIATILYAGLSLNKYPRVFNYMIPITAENAVSQYSFATRMIRVLKCSMILIFSLLAVYSYWTVDGKSILLAGGLCRLFSVLFSFPLFTCSLKAQKDQKKFSISYPFYLCYLLVRKRLF